MHSTATDSIAGMCRYAVCPELGWRVNDDGIPCPAGKAKPDVRARRQPDRVPSQEREEAKARNFFKSQWKRASMTLVVYALILI